jgi:hypothetical protein
MLPPCLQLRQPRTLMLPTAEHTCHFLRKGGAIDAERMRLFRNRADTHFSDHPDLRVIWLEGRTRHVKMTREHLCYALYATSSNSYCTRSFLSKLDFRKDTRMTHIGGDNKEIKFARSISSIVGSFPCSTHVRMQCREVPQLSPITRTLYDCW